MLKMTKCNDGVWRENPNPKQIQEPRFYDDEGYLTPYGFACGYLERVEMGDKDVVIRVEMYREHCIYHVRGFYECNNPNVDFENKERYIRLFWKVFDDNYEKALAFYKAMGR